MNFFDNLDRNITRPKQHDESRFEYLNSSARTECEKIRRLMEEWFNHYPPEHQDDLRGRFRERDDRAHVSAFFELYLHELMIQSDYEVKIHPNIEGTINHPDFEVKAGELEFYLEAMLSTISDEEIAAEARKNQVYDILNRMNTPDFFIGLEVEGAPETSPPGSKLREYLERELSKLDPDQISERYTKDGRDVIPSWDWEYEGWNITFYPIPKKSEFRGETGSRPIATKIEGGFFDLHTGIKRSIKEKASKYGVLHSPYIIAVNVWNPKHRIDNFTVMNALFGELQVNALVNKKRQKTERKPNGASSGPKGPRNQKVSAVLTADNLNP